ncbi:MAG: ABC transporter ATP-binding protein [Bacteroidota bacterium]
MSIIDIKSVYKSFGELRALDNITFSVEASEIFGLIGPDGAGKTSLFRIIASLLIPDQGEVRVCDLNVVKDYREIRKLIGYMAGRFSLYHDLTVEENLKFYSTVFGTRVRDNYDLIKDIYHQIEPFRKRKAGALSGGMKQKLALSCALIHRPRLLILDEPTTGVDAVSRKEFWDLLHHIRKEEITVIVSTPYMDEALKCDRVALIQKGDLLSVSKPDDLTSGFESLLYSVSSEHENYSLLKSFREKKWCKSAWLFGQDIHVSIHEEMQEDFESEIQSLSSITKCQKIAPGIEDTFIELMKK